MLVREDIKDILVGKSLEDIDRDLREKYLGKIYKRTLSGIVKVLDIIKGDSSTSFRIKFQEFNVGGIIIKSYYVDSFNDTFVEVNIHKWLEHEERIKNRNIEEADNRYKKVKKFLNIK